MQKDRPLSMEHCVAQVANRFELVALVSQRARDLAAGHQSVLQDIPQYSRQKNFSIALQEIDLSLLNIEALRERYISSFAPKNFIDLYQQTGGEVSVPNIEEDTETPAYYVAAVDLDVDSEESGEHIFFEDVEIDETEK